ncbi:MAG TPA: hypothetical protein VFV50_11190 [Bdellovibrionales bacterium]|nr:hypothetical protein [Bdellovibrionales bacterium]
MRLLLFFSLFLSSSFVNAQEGVHHNLSIAGGIAHPSDSLALSQNPAGLIYGKSTRVHLSLEQGRDQGPVGLGGGMIAGTETVGGAVFLRDYNTEPGSVSRIYLFNLGMGVTVSPLNLAFGIAASKTLGKRDPLDSTNSCTNWCVDAGVIYNPAGAFRVAANLTQLSDSNYLLGGGVAYDATQELVLVADAQTDTQKNTMVLKPGIGIFIQGIQVTGSYGFRAWGSREAGLRQGWGAGLSASFIQNMLIEFYTNQFTHYYLGATLGL